MPMYVRPDGRTDLAQTTIALAAHFKDHARGRRNVMTAEEIADKYDITLGQAARCARGARVLLRAEDPPEVLASRPGPGGGWFVADEEEQAREYAVRRSYDALSRIENIARDSRAAIRGVVSKAPLTRPWWSRTENQLDSIAGDLRRVQRDLQINAAAALEGGGSAEGADASDG
jgi:hypothetical protein